MPNTYNLRIETPLSVEQVTGVAAKANNITLKDNKSPISFSVDYVFVVGVESPNNKITRQVYLEEYDFIPTVNLTFEHGYTIDANIVNPIIARTVSAVLKEVQGNAVFLYNSEEIKLKRINDKLIVDKSRYYDWLAEGLSEANIEYKRQEINNPALV